MPGVDRLRTFTRAGFTPLVPLTAVFGPALILFAGSTADFWAWEIRPDASAAFIGAGYTFGAVTITTMLVLGRWRSAIVPVISTWPFAVGLLVATLIHDDRFFTGSPRFWIWMAVYAGLPVFLPAAWALNRGADPGRRPDDAVFPAPLAALIAGIGALLSGLALVMFVDTGFAASLWPWELTPLMARMVASWLLFWGVAALCLSVERRVRAYRPFLPAAALWPALLLVSSFAYPGDFTDDDALWIWRALLAVVTVAELALLAYCRALDAQPRDASARRRATASSRG